MRTESYKDKSRTERYYNMDIIHLFCEFKLLLHNGFVIFIAFCFFRTFFVHKLYGQKKIPFICLKYWKVKSLSL